MVGCTWYLVGILQLSYYFITLLLLTNPSPGPIFGRTTVCVLLKALSCHVLRKVGVSHAFTARRRESNGFYKDLMFLGHLGVLFIPYPKLKNGRDMGD